MSAVTPKSEVQAMFKGTKILLPDIPSTLPGWRVTEREDCSPYVKEAINSWAKSISQDEAFFKKTAAAKFGLVAQFLYPDGDEEALATIACFYAWVWAWDDVFDTQFEGVDSMQIREETTLNFEYLLADPPGPKPSVVSPLNSSFSWFAGRIKKKMCKEPRERLLRDLKEFVHNVTSWYGRQDDNVPTLSEYYVMRRECVGVAPTIDLIEYCYGLDIPPTMVGHRAFQQILEKTRDIVMISNDMVSLARELRAGHVDNIVSVLAYHEGMSPQEAMDHAAVLLRQAHADFESAERDLPLPSGNDTSDEELRKFVLGCKDVCAGLMKWSNYTGRYFGENPTYEDGKILVHF
ncbi:uncharacterized protein LAJ45_04133 [Morchella importuna]|uniref:uncharacterized protein n=1 Tax=Morchella importuna TaxID=1174673 RepID=UPI001E8CF5EC|nr:uncharacterized protein LAJ45_04133 [Morchella importuna]KAH8151512.1 hypothetical protein LAJ45_04133 [Morchella importuna]